MTRPAASASTAPAASGAAGCAACWGVKAPTIGQAIDTVINHLFNSTFDLLSTLPGGPLTNLLEGTLILVRRTLFLIPTGVTATQTGTELTVKVNTGSVAYVRQDGGHIEVSGLPSFRRADQFNGATVTDVSVSNPGNAGCAGFVLESGTVAASLTTAQIDSMRFGADAAFAGTVTATVTGGPLTLQDAVRSRTGVRFAAPVVLKNNVAVEAGNGDVSFGGTVDAAEAGKQSLMVTALGTTTFAAAVGGQAALASLLTRGIAPLSVTQSTDSKTVPLHFLPEVDVNSKGEVKGKVEVKYGIDVAIGDNASQLYEFDTGGVGFWAGFNPSFWQNVPLSATPVSTSFSSGNSFEGVVADGMVTIGQGAQTVSTAQPIQVAAAFTGSNSKKSDTPFVFTNPDAPPVDGNFFGDFGASFKVKPVTGLDEPLASPLFQLPGNLSSGFLVQLGPIGTDPRLTVGLTDELRDQFPYAIPVRPDPAGDTYPVSNYPVLEFLGISANYFAQDGDGPKVPIGCDPGSTDCPQLRSLIDSGAPSTSIRLTQATAPYEQGNHQLMPGVDLIAEFPTTQGRAPLTWTVTAGDISSVNLVKYETDSKESNVNTGLNLYNDFDVMFDVQNRVIWLRPTNGQATVSAGSVTTTGDQTYLQNAQLGGTYSTGGGRFTVGGATELTGDTVINAGAGDVTFYGAVDADMDPPGAQSLAVNSTGSTVFRRMIGEQFAIQSLTTDAGGATTTAGVKTIASQSYGDDVVLSGPYTLADGSFTVEGDAVLGNSVKVINGSANPIVFDGGIEGTENRGFQLRFSAKGGSIDLNGDVGAAAPLGGLAVESRSDQKPVTFTARGSINLQGGGNAFDKGLLIEGPVQANLANGGVIQGFTDSGLVIGKGGSGTISGFVISNNGRDGIQANDTSDLTLSGNVILANKSNGIKADKGSDLRLLKNTVNSNGADGITIKDTDGAEIRGNTVDTNVDSGILVEGKKDSGILVEGKKTVVTIKDNTVTGNGKGTGPKDRFNGISVEDTAELTIKDNSVTANFANGIQLHNVDNASIVGNAVTANGTADLFNGIFVHGGSGSAISKNTISSNGLDGILTEDANALDIEENTISANGRNGVTVDGSTGNAILSNSIFKNAKSGIALQNNGNADQQAPADVTAQLDNDTLTVTGTVSGSVDYQIQVFVSPSSDADNVQGPTLVTTRTGIPAGAFTISVQSGSVIPGSFVTLTATPTTGPANSSPFSDATLVKS